MKIYHYEILSMNMKGQIIGGYQLAPSSEIKIENNINLPFHRVEVHDFFLGNPHLVCCHSSSADYSLFYLWYVLFLFCPFVLCLVLLTVLYISSGPFLIFLSFRRRKIRFENAMTHPICARCYLTFSTNAQIFLG